MLTCAEIALFYAHTSHYRAGNREKDMSHSIQIEDKAAITADQARALVGWYMTDHRACIIDQAFTDFNSRYEVAAAIEDEDRFVLVISDVGVQLCSYDSEGYGTCCITLDGMYARLDSIGRWVAIGDASEDDDV